MTEKIQHLLLITGLGTVGSLVFLMHPQPTLAATITVCSSGCNYTTIQAAVNAAATGDTVLVSSGTYSGGITINQTIVLASHFINSGSQTDINNTIINGGSPAVGIATSAGGTKVIGFTFNASDKHVQTFDTVADVLNNHFYGGGDCVSYEGGDGLVKNNLFENCGDDGVDLDQATSVTIEDNTFRGSSDDGIEIRLHADEGKTLKTIIRGNSFNGRRKGVESGRNGRNSIQIMDQGQKPNRTIIIERNLFTNQNVAGISLTCDCTSENTPSAITLAQPIRVYNNTLVNNNWGLAGGGNLVALNNIFYNNPIGFLNHDNSTSHTIIAYSLWNGNSTNYDLNYQGVLDTSHDLTGDPQFANQLNFYLGTNSPAINAGTINYTNPHTGENLANFTSYTGNSPDLGWHETGVTITPTSAPVSSAKQYLAAYGTVNPSLDKFYDGIINLLDYLNFFNLSFPTPTIISSGSGSQLQLARVITTTPFVNSTTSVNDTEGMVYDPVNQALWLSDDNNNKLYQVNLATEELISTISNSQLAQATKLNSTETAGVNRAGDLEGLTYDPNTDILYVFSGVTSAIPTAFRLIRNPSTHQFTVETFQPLAHEYSGAAFRPQGQLYGALNVNHAIEQYDYQTNTMSNSITLPIDGIIYGMEFTADGNQLWLVTDKDLLYQLDWSTKQVIHQFDLLPFEINDARAVMFLNNQVYVLDGDDVVGHHSVYVFNLVN